ncbi:MAG: ATP-grasp domain-containing protein [Micrococcaceae bacterium]
MKLVIVEALTSGLGLGLVKSALKETEQVYFLTRDINRYEFDANFDLLKNPPTNLTIVKVETEDSQSIVKKANELDITNETWICPIEAFFPALAEAKQQGINWNPAKNILALYDKEEQRKVTQELQLPKPKFFVGKAADLDFFPAVAKPTSGAGSVGVSLIINKENTKELNSNQTYLFEEFLIGQLVSFEVLRTQGETHLLGISDRTMGRLPYFIGKSISFPTNIDSEFEKSAMDQINAILDEIELNNGAAHIEYMLTKNGPRLIEINPRLGGMNLAGLMSIAYDTNIWDIVLAAYLGKEIQLPEIKKGASEVPIQAEKTGTIIGITGVELAREIPGFLGIRDRTKNGGMVIKDIKDAKARYVSVWTEAETTLEARNRAEAAASMINPIYK